MVIWVNLELSWMFYSEVSEDLQMVILIIYCKSICQIFHDVINNILMNFTVIFCEIQFVSKRVEFTLLRSTSLSIYLKWLDLYNELYIIIWHIRYSYNISNILLHVVWKNLHKWISLVTFAKRFFIILLLYNLFVAFFVIMLTIK